MRKKTETEDPIDLTSTKDETDTGVVLAALFYFLLNKYTMIKMYNSESDICFTLVY